MRLACIGSAALLALGLAGRPAAAAPAATGDYLETRSCNLFVGACHAEGERPTTGRQAILAWKIDKGAYNGVNLDGVTAVALVTADRNLADEKAVRKSVLYIDYAKCNQREAMAALLKANAAASLGTVLDVQNAAITFKKSAALYEVSIPTVTTVKVKTEPGELCCNQKYEVWYKPFVALKESKIGYSVLSEFKDRTLATSWAGGAQNSAYFGQFSF